MALKLGVTPLVIGLTVVAYGTSSPEVAVSVRAAAAGRGSIALGNVVGSNICNMGLILGLGGLTRPLRVHSSVVRQDVPVMIVVTLLLVGLLADGLLGRLEGALLVLGAVAYSAWCVLAARREAGVTRVPSLTPPPPSRGRTGGMLFLIAAGLVLLVAGAHLLVHGAVGLAEKLGVAQAVIGLSVVAVGTSLPELATSVTATLKRESDIAVGNVVGSNIFNILAIAGIAALVRPLEAGGVSAVDLVAMLVLAGLTLPLMRTGFTLSRREGAVLLLLYAGYMAHLFYRG